MEIKLETWRNCRSSRALARSRSRNNRDKLGDQHRQLLKRPRTASDSPVKNRSGGARDSAPMIERWGIQSRLLDQNGRTPPPFPKNGRPKHEVPQTVPGASADGTVMDQPFTVVGRWRMQKTPKAEAVMFKVTGMSYAEIVHKLKTQVFQKLTIMNSN